MPLQLGWWHWGEESVNGGELEKEVENITPQSFNEPKSEKNLPNVTCPPGFPNPVTAFWVSLLQIFHFLHQMILDLYLGTGLCCLWDNHSKSSTEHIFLPMCIAMLTTTFANPAGTSGFAGLWMGPGPLWDMHAAGIGGVPSLPTQSTREYAAGARELRQGRNPDSQLSQIINTHKYFSFHDLISSSPSFHNRTSRNRHSRPIYIHIYIHINTHALYCCFCSKDGNNVPERR